MIERLDDLRSQVDSLVNSNDTKQKGVRRNNDSASNTDAISSKKVQRATSANPNSIRNQRFIM